MPKELFGKDYEFLAGDRLLSFDEIARITGCFAEAGTAKVRLTGGEPLLRRDLEDLIRSLRAIPGVEDLTLTTNGTLLARKAESLAAAGLDRVTVSLDSLDDDNFTRMNDVGFPVARVLGAIDAASEAGLTPLKINAVIKKGVNDHEVVDLARRFKGTGHIIRFIEFMDVGTTNGWRLDDVMPAAEIVERIDAAMALEPVEPNYPGEVAGRFRYRDGSGEIGVVASVSAPFCGSCTRVRLSAEGSLFTCLFAAKGHDLRDLLRSGATDEELDQAIQRIWKSRADRYSEIRSEDTEGWERVEMSYIGG